MQNPLISVIVPVYKVEKYIHNCINSVLNQTYQNWELILVDDGSPDNCPQICDEYAQKDKRIKVIHKENGGVASARNLALDHISGELVSFLDSDDFWHKNYLSTLSNIIIKYDVDIVQCTTTRGHDREFPKINEDGCVKIFDSRDVFTEGYANIIVCAKMYKSFLFDKIRMPIGKFYEDDFTTWKWYFASKKIAVLNKTLYYYTYNGDSTMSQHCKKPNLTFFEAYDERINFFIDKKERAMEEMSRLQFCKSLLLTWGNPNLTNDQKTIVFKRFKENWTNIKQSKYIPIKFKCLFRLFNVCPAFSIKLVKSLRK